MIIPVILCGGSGTRLWPLSRKSYPKQLVDALGPLSLFQETASRAAGGPFGKPIVIAGDDYRFLIAEQLKTKGIEADIVLEPEGRDTFPAIVAAAVLATKRSPEASVLVMPSDHVIADTVAFQAAAEEAGRAAEAGDIVTFGIAPTRPATEYGYIRPGESLAVGKRIETFLEKPDAGTAKRLIEEGCLWNSGLFCFKAGALLTAAEALNGDSVAAVRAGVAEIKSDLDYLRLGESFRKARKISFDYAVMEQLADRAVIPVSFPWSDVGDWRELWNMSLQDADGNVAVGDVRLQGVTGSYVRASGRLVCVLGLEGVAVIDTPDAVLVAALDKAQQVKALAQSLDREGREEAKVHSRVYRPWGWYQTVDLGGRFRVKRIGVTPGRQLSLQKHFHRAEHWVVVQGTAEVRVDDKVSIVRENESVFIPMGSVHRLTNPGRIPVELIEVQTGAYLEEDDIVRLQDDFGRA
ncbi:MAG: mannose-1-phosphate guanylyltransferase/mannose-6-phosphate isomerase [Rhodospirillales bacterium]|nr:mannose-1-phosphate guanylyltransferase/mannose-6-phosphate isomerase [Rhodospirillales bacterium]